MEKQVQVYSPRWGHNDTYTVVFTRDYLTVSHLPRSARCEWVEDRDPVWVEEGALEKNLINDHVYPAVNFSESIVYVWFAWRDARLNDDAAGEELEALFEWLNASTRAKPSTDFWIGMF